MNASPQQAEPTAPITAAEATLLFAPLATETRLLAAVSGGPDSVALLALLAEWAAVPGRPKLHGATVDHDLRAGSAGEARQVAALCDERGMPHATLTWAGEKPVSRLQELARGARYRLLAAEAQRLGGAVVVTAHTLDDQAETLLMRMARGSGPAGLAGMRASTRRHGITIARPLLGVTKARLIETLRVRGLGFAEDPSNRDLRFERVRWRALAPALAQAGLDAGRLGLLAARLARMDDALSARVGQLWADLVVRHGDGEIELRFAALRDEPDEIALRVLARALDGLAGDGLARLERLEACLFALRDGAARGAEVRRTLAGCVLRLGRDGVLYAGCEAPRRRGVHRALA